MFTFLPLHSFYTPDVWSATPAKYYQCGGMGYVDNTNCEPGTKCVVWNVYYSQCMRDPYPARKQFNVL
ncbi:hypothetical protein BJ165DRAFT_1458215 [Panaeolus papilionaceus]|nr:hypothetical protein BJ165DRAFT_1458215 [Panaeolus papilionaceus]